MQSRYLWAALVSGLFPLLSSVVPAEAAENARGEGASDDTATRRWSHADQPPPNRRDGPAETTPERPPDKAPPRSPKTTRPCEFPPRVEFNNYKASYLRM